MKLIPLVLLAATLGCGAILNRGGSDRGPYEITTNRGEYARGSTGEASIRNVTDGDLLYNLCPRRLERRVGDGWVAANEWPGAGGACTLELRTLRAGESVNALFDIPGTVSPGSYRMVFLGLKGPGESGLPADRQATPPFAVQ